MRIPTPEQKAILESAARIRFVRAVPGSGKTWLVAELIRKELEKWPMPVSGIAALSFTRVGGDEIRSAVGYELEHPHFVGTIDAFLFRYVIRPYFQSCFPNFASPHLIPGEWGADIWSNYGTQQKIIVGRGINLFGCVFTEEKQGEIIIAHKPHPSVPLQELNGSDLKMVKQGKNQLWKEAGCLTHSDAAFLASRILDHRSFGPAIRAEILRRFPLLIVDELQDTGYFLGKCLQILLKEHAIRGILVGDPDQAIFEFNGAKPDLFKEFEAIQGSVPFPLSFSLRCPPDIAKVACHLKDSNGIISPSSNNIGQAYLIRYSDMKIDLDQIKETLKQTNADKNIHIIARGNETIVTLNGRQSEVPPRLGCPALYYIHLAVMKFRQGRYTAALADALTALNLAVFKHEGVTDTKLKRNNIDPSDWKALGIDCLLKANMLTNNVCVLDWQKLASKILNENVSRFISIRELKLDISIMKPQKRNGWEKASAECLPKNRSQNNSLNDFPVETVHAVKGRTHDLTVFVCPPNNRASNCPSNIWWSTVEKDREERRIAYVAITRTQGDLVLFVSETCYQRLVSTRPEFVRDFRCMTTKEFISILENST